MGTYKDNLEDRVSELESVLNDTIKMVDAKQDTINKLHRKVADLSELAEFWEYLATKREKQLIGSYTLTEKDYYDSEKDQYVLTLDSTCFVSSETTINDDGMSWNCYLLKMTYNKKADNYTAIYKIY